MAANISNPIVSVIISTYNSAEFIVGRLDDLVHQTIFPLTEIIIVNSGSQQNEEELIQPYLSKYKNIRYIYTAERETIYKAWNRAIQISHGTYITNANTDDRLRFDALEILSDALNKDSTVGLVYADQYITNLPNQTFHNHIRYGKYTRPDFSRLRLIDAYMAGSQSMWRASLHFVDGVWFNCSYEVAGDYDFACRVAEKYRLLHINKFLGLYYKSKTDSNKEYQNISKTLQETFNVQHLYMKRYLHTMSIRKKKELLFKFKMLTLIPVKVYSLLRLILERVTHKVTLPLRYKLFWFISVIYENMGEMQKARRACIPYVDIPFENILSLQLQNLENEDSLDG